MVDVKNKSGVWEKSWSQEIGVRSHYKPKKANWWTLGVEEDAKDKILGISKKKSTWQREIICSQVELQKPDWKYRLGE